MFTAIVPIATARQSVDLDFTMTAFKPTSAGSGLFGLRQIGPSPDRFVGGAKFDMGASDVKHVPTYRTEADIPQTLHTGLPGRLQHREAHQRRPTRQRAQ